MKLYGEAVGKEGKAGREEMGPGESWFKVSSRRADFRGSEVMEDSV